MIAADKAWAGVTAWLAVTFVSIFSFYSGQLHVLTSGLDQLLSSTLGTVFPAYPFLALLILLVALRWREFRPILLSEGGPLTKPLIRLIGAALILFPAVFWAAFLGDAATATQYLLMEVAAASLVLATYGSLLLTSPSMWRIMLPYASLFAVGLVSPLFLVDAFGAPMAQVSSYMAAAITKAMGVPVAWQGVYFSFVSTGGEPISSVVTPACSAVYSVGIYLGLLCLMYLDMRSSLGTLVRYALIGVAIIPPMDSARIAITIWFGFKGGAAAFWGVHDWLGYGLFLAFYLAVLFAYSREVRGLRLHEGQANRPAAF